MKVGSLILALDKLCLAKPQNELSRDTLDGNPFICHDDQLEELKRFLDQPNPKSGTAAKICRKQRCFFIHSIVQYLYYQGAAVIIAGINYKNGDKKREIPPITTIWCLWLNLHTGHLCNHLHCRWIRLPTITNTYTETPDNVFSREANKLNSFLFQSKKSTSSNYPTWQQQQQHNQKKTKRKKEENLQTISFFFFFFCRPFQLMIL